MIVDELEGLTEVDGSPWRPDILRETRDRRSLLIEVKPNYHSQNIITAIGQLIAYGQDLSDVVKIIAAPGVHKLYDEKRHLHDAIKAQRIELLDLDKDLRPQLQRVLAKKRSSSR